MFYIIIMYNKMVYVSVAMKCKNIRKTVIADCDTSGSLDGDKDGLITSPRYPGHYPDNQDCSLTIRSEEGVILLNILVFDTESPHDFLTVGVK